MGAAKKRASITTMRFLAKAQSVILDNREYWPLTVRRVHYLLLNDPPLRHDKKPGSVYVNDKASYKALTNLLIRARLSGMCQWHPLRTAPGQYKMAAAFLPLKPLSRRKQSGS